MSKFSPDKRVDPPVATAISGPRTYPLSVIEGGMAVESGAAMVSSTDLLPADAVLRKISTAAL
jgi:hypothetical protein